MCFFSFKKVKREDFKFTSVVGDLDIHAVKWVADKQPKAIFQITHGMAEHIERYAPFAEYLAANGFVVYGHDHIGHGGSINDTYFPGFFGYENEEGQVFVDDCHQLTEIAKEEYPGLPVVFFGHSMGSLVARKYTSLYGDGIDAAIFCGTVGPNPLAGIAITLSGLLSKGQGATKPGTIIDTLAFGSYNAKTDKRTSFDWLTNVESIVDEYIADPLCGFKFSNQGFHDMLTLMQYVNTPDCPKHMPKDLPILLISGDMDPCGEYTKGVDKVAKAIDKRVDDVTLIFYEDARHEILNEEDAKTVMENVVDFVNEKLFA